MHVTKYCIFCYTFQCILSSSDGHCPSLSCEQLIQIGRKEWFQAIWDKQYAEYKSTVVSVFETKPGEQNVLHITVLNGDTAESSKSMSKGFYIQERNLQ